MQQSKKSLLRIFLDLPPYIIRFILIMIASLILLLFFAGHLACKYDGKLECVLGNGEIKPKVIEEEIWYGYYYTLNNEEENVCEEEKFYITRENSKNIVGHSEGSIDRSDGSRSNMKVDFKGVQDSDNLSLAYTMAAEDDDVITTDSGVYYLPYRKDYYAGYWLGADFPNRYLVQCPYVLINSIKPKKESCEKRWPDTFNPSNNCKKILSR